jgi:predicted amidophosphoribosyltransferase
VTALADGEFPAGPPAGFPQCATCPYARTGPARICVACAGKTLEPVSSSACPVCSQALDDNEICRNSLCWDNNRRISKVYAVTYHSGALKKVIHRYKYDGAYGWGLIFGRLVIGWLEAHAPAVSPDLIVANPTYAAEGRFEHTEFVIRNAANEDLQQRWPFDVATPRTIIKTGPTTASAGASATAKRSSATLLRSVLTVTDASRTAGRRILIYDDVCTTGMQLNAVADSLLTDGGAAQVEALVLARAPWR